MLRVLVRTPVMVRTRVPARSTCGDHDIFCDPVRKMGTDDGRGGSKLLLRLFALEVVFLAL